MNDVLKYDYLGNVIEDTNDTYKPPALSATFDCSNSFASALDELEITV